jgi:hypothetical protein
MNGSMDRWMDGEMEEWMNESMNELINYCPFSSMIESIMLVDESFELEISDGGGAECLPARLHDLHRNS